MALKTRGYAHRIDIAAPLPRVWTVLCGPSLMPLWAGKEARVRPQKGGHWTTSLAPGLVREAVIDVFDPPRRLRLIYLTPPDLPVFDGAVVDDVLLEGEGGNSVVRLLCSGVPDLPDWRKHYAQIRAIGERQLARLKVICEQRERMAETSRSAT